MADNNFKGAVEALFSGVDGMISSKTVVGDAIHIGDTIILPLVDVSFGVGAGAGIAYLLEGTYEAIAHTIVNAVAIISGTICDGAKPSCAMKVSSGVSTAMLSALMAMENKVVTPVEGIIDEDVDKSIINLTSIGSKGMEATDKLVLDIMTGKSC